MMKMLQALVVSGDFSVIRTSSNDHEVLLLRQSSPNSVTFF